MIFLVRCYTNVNLLSGQTYNIMLAEVEEEIYTTKNFYKEYYNKTCLTIIT